MKKVSFFSVVALGLFLNSCTPEVQFKDISEYSISDDVIDNNQLIELIYSSATPGGEEPLSYLIQVIALNRTTGDTINILTTFNRGGGNGEAKNEFTFFKIDSEEGEKFFYEIYNKNSETQHTIDEIKNITRVSYDPRFDYLTENHYPTVYGFFNK